MNQLTKHGVLNLNSLGNKPKRTRDYHPELMDCDHQDTEVLNFFGGDQVVCANCKEVLHLTSR